MSLTKIKYTMRSLKKMNHLFHLTFLKLRNFFTSYIYNIVKMVRPNLRTSLKYFMSLPSRISEFQLVGKQEKLVLCFPWKIKICAHRVKFIYLVKVMENVNNVEKIMLVSQKETVLHVGENMINPLINLYQPGI